MKVTIGKYAWYLIPTMYAYDDSKAIVFSENESWSWIIGIITVNLSIPLSPNEIVLEQDKFWEWVSIFDSLKSQWIIDELTRTSQSWFNLYKVVSLTDKWLALFNK